MAGVRILDLVMCVCLSFSKIGLHSAAPGWSSKIVVTFFNRVWRNPSNQNQSIMLLDS
uniref:Uncharacterized protein n=1 Tax=Rhizophora mucronata TaxID=61149 RepID=A0A2P2JG50_RHIMU